MKKGWMKRFLAFSLVCLMLLSLVGCGKGDEGNGAGILCEFLLPVLRRAGALFYHRRSRGDLQKHY